MNEVISHCVGLRADEKKVNLLLEFSVENGDNSQRLIMEVPLDRAEALVKDMMEKLSEVNQSIRVAMTSKV